MFEEIRSRKSYRALADHLGYLGKPRPISTKVQGNWQAIWRVGKSLITGEELETKQDLNTILGKNCRGMEDSTAGDHVCKLCKSCAEPLRLRSISCRYFCAMDRR